MCCSCCSIHIHCLCWPSCCSFWPLSRALAVLACLSFGKLCGGSNGKDKQPAGSRRQSATLVPKCSIRFQAKLSRSSRPKVDEFAGNLSCRRRAEWHEVAGKKLSKLAMVIAGFAANILHQSDVAAFQGAAPSSTSSPSPSTLFLAPNWDYNVGDGCLRRACATAISQATLRLTDCST